MINKLTIISRQVRGYIYPFIGSPSRDSFRVGDEFVVREDVESMDENQIAEHVFRRAWVLASRETG